LVTLFESLIALQYLFSAPTKTRGSQNRVIATRF
jgi:hypothetical protein